MKSKPIFGPIKSPVCRQGHQFINRGNRQVCTICERARVQKYRAKKKKSK